METAGASVRSGLAAMKLTELKGLAAGLGITGTTKMRKDDLVAVIAARQGGPTRSRPAESGGGFAGGAAQNGGSARAPRRAVAAQGGAAAPAERADEPGSREPQGQQDRPAQQERDGAGSGRSEDGERPEGRERPWERRRRERGPADGSDGSGQREGQQSQQGQAQRDGQQAQQGQAQRDGQQAQQGQAQRDGQQAQQGQAQRDGQQAQQGQGQRDGQQSQGQQGGQYRQQGGNRYDDDGDGRSGRRRNRQRSRDRKRGRSQLGGMPMGQESSELEPQIGEDDVLVPAAGILDVLDNYAFVRTSGYLPGPDDVYVPLGMVRRYGLRKGDAVTGAVKALRDGEAPTAPSGNRAKFNPLVRLDTVNGQHPDQAKNRVEFNKLTPLYPQERMRLETTPSTVTTRVIDLVSPIGKGQRGLIVSPPKAGKTLILQAIANAITTNNPEVHLMVVLVDERPEEVTDMQRTVRGEVIASTFDRPADDHTTIAELAIERAKRLVEMGHDVVVLLDSITRLGRAYNLAAPASGRILSGGVDSAALYPPKRFFGAARNIEHGGSLTILATALVETGSKMDEVIFEEFKGTGNMELKLSRELANRRIFPAVDVNASGTRREEILMGSDELKIMWKLRRVLSALDPQQGIELLLDRLKKTKGNLEFLVQVQRTSSIKLDDDDDD
jgi:transcription termination factor Rho